MSASHVIPKLWQGSKPPEGPGLAAQGFRLLVLCAREIQPHSQRFPGLIVLHAPLDDDPSRDLSAQEIQIAHGAADAVARAVSQGHRTLVTCAMGLNRSGLVVALAMTRGMGALGVSPQTAVALVRRARGNDALGNRRFVKHLFSLSPGDSPQ